MLTTVKKMCVGYKREPHLAYIYKNIAGKKYCINCANRKNPPKPIRKVSEKQQVKRVFKIKLLKEDKEFYLSLWYERFGRVEGTAEKYGHTADNSEIMPGCEVCKARLYFQPTTVNFHHILEKRNYPQFRHEKWNIAILCPDCHSSYESNPDNVPYLRDKRKALLESPLIIKP